MPVADRATGGQDDDTRLRDAEIRLARLEERQAADVKARELAVHEIDRRLEGMNEIREQINSERGRYEERERADERHSLLVLADASLETRLTALEANATAQRRATGWLVGGATLLIGIVVLITNLLT